MHTHLFGLFLVTSKISSNFKMFFSLSWFTYMDYSYIFFSLLNVETKQQKTFSLESGCIFLLCWISKLFQGFKAACKTIFHHVCWVEQDYWGWWTIYVLKNIRIAPEGHLAPFSKGVMGIWDVLSFLYITNLRFPPQIFWINSIYQKYHLLVIKKKNPTKILPFTWSSTAHY